jgi:hypothetical protein
MAISATPILFGEDGTPTLEKYAAFLSGFLTSL